ncbi:MAG: hypothetical protein HYY93_00755 [Planctomycetes bacterium]|nr:hypothetical protein [Planctomycetota bacterium]
MGIHGREGLPESPRCALSLRRAPPHVPRGSPGTDGTAPGRRVITFLALLFAFGAVPGPAQDAGPYTVPEGMEGAGSPPVPAVALTPEEAASIEHLLEECESRNERIRRNAVDALLEKGAVVAPLLRRRLIDRQAASLADLLVALAAGSSPLSPHSSPADPAGSRRSAPPPEARLNADQFKALLAAVPVPASATAEQYLYTKFLQAAELYQKGRYDQCQSLCEAIIVLETGLPFMDRVKQLKVVCEEREIERHLVRARVTTGRPVYEIGDPIDCTLTVTNVSAHSLKLVFAEPPADASSPAQRVGYARASVQVAEYDPYGGADVLSRDIELALPDEITIDPGRDWSSPFTIDSSMDAPVSRRFRTYRVSIEFRSPTITRADMNTMRRLVSETLEIRVFPPDVDPVLKSPMEFFARAMDSGAANDIFLCALLVPEHDQKKAVALCMTALPRATEDGQRCLMTCLKWLTHLPFEYDAAAWTKWWEGQDDGEGEN